MSLPLSAQTAEDSVAIVTARWETAVSPEGMIHKRVLIPQLYKGSQSINLIEIPSGRKLHYGVAVSEMKPISRLARENRALAAINGSFYNMQKGNSVCFLKIGKEVVDTTTTQEFKLRVTGSTASPSAFASEVFPPFVRERIPNTTTATSDMMLRISDVFFISY